MQEEMDSHKQMKTWGPIDLPKGATSTNTKFLQLFSVKAINLSHNYNNADIALKANKQVLGGDGGEYERY